MGIRLTFKTDRGDQNTLNRINILKVKDAFGF